MTNFEEYKKLLAEFVSFKSISTDPKFQPEIAKTVLWLKNLLAKKGFKVEIWRGATCNPVVFASYDASKDAKTILIYGHYDVQPAEKSDGWKSEPFNLNEAKSKFFARGVGDNKGQILAHIATTIRLIKDKSLGVNIKFLIEGNEETSNPDLPKIMEDHKKKLTCDIVMVSDGELTNNKPTIEVSLRGGFNCTLTFTTGKNNLHSGLFGGAVPNAAKELTAFLTKLINPDGTIRFKDFYKASDKITTDELSNNRKLAKEAKNLADLAGVKALHGKKGVDFFTLTGLMPTIQITGLKSGYIDTGYANIVPKEAEARLNFRIVASQDPKNVAADFEKFVKTNVPKYVNYNLTFNGLHKPIKVNIQNEYAIRAEKILNEVYKTHVNRKNVGGAIPFVSDVKEILGVDTLLVPMVNEDCNMHGTDENFDINLTKKALEFSSQFLKK